MGLLHVFTGDGGVCLRLTTDVHPRELASTMENWSSKHTVLQQPLKLLCWEQYLCCADGLPSTTCRLWHRDGNLRSSKQCAGQCH